MMYATTPNVLWLGKMFKPRKKRAVVDVLPLIACHGVPGTVFRDSAYAKLDG
jgi:hypothetical protein